MYLACSTISNSQYKILAGPWVVIYSYVYIREIEKHAYYQNYCIDSNQILHSDKDHPMPFVGGPNTYITNPRWRTAAILEKFKIAISRPRFDGFRPNLTRRCSSALFSRPTVKNLKFETSKMAAAAILKNRKIAISRPRFGRFRPNLACRRSSAS